MFQLFSCSLFRSPLYSDTAYSTFVKYYLVIESIVEASAISKLNNAITLTLVMNIGVGNLAG